MGVPGPAHYRLRRDLLALLIGGGMTAIAEMLSGAWHLPDPVASAQIVLGASTAAILFGVWFAREWARRSCGILGIVQGTFYLLLVTALGDVMALSATQAIIGMLFWWTIPWLVFHPSARLRFSVAREAIVSSR